MLLDVMSFNFLLSIADWTTRLGTNERRSLGFPILQFFVARKIAVRNLKIFTLKTQNSAQ